MIYLDKKYRIVGVPNNFTLEYKVDQKDIDHSENTKEWKVYGYYANLKILAKAYVDIKTLDYIGDNTIETTFNEVLSKIEKLKKTLEEKLDYKKDM